MVAIWGTTFVFTKLLLNAGLTAAQIFVLRFVVAYILLLGMYLCNKRQKEAGVDQTVNNSVKSR